MMFSYLIIALLFTFIIFLISQKVYPRNHDMRNFLYSLIIGLFWGVIMPSVVICAIILIFRRKKNE